ncbi:DUF1800 domain-containing protein [Occallatibacter riparius]|uniref:DUF1800 domain-containing protein n=1 Tax=Occallatibacter riparius TaxID=1002689 RepID=A0A9J7BUD6_9BACT|nr:DUF1800 domain-containing protein [Occallatibacter riparius]UWZ84542.1 DUF1800 domain-containing protein [Occallatibacter riparius]
MSVRSPLAGLLCILLAFPMPGLAAADAKARPEYHKAMQGDERILHALNRFTFGPRAGDRDAVRGQGLDVWFEQQLHPGTIDNRDMEERLKEYPAMRLSPAELLVRFPNNAVMRQVANGKLTMPEHGVLHTVYANQAARVALKKEEKAQANPSATTPTAENGMMAENPKAETAAFRDPQETRTLMALEPRDRLLRLMAMQGTELDQFMKGLSGPEKLALVAGFTPEMRETLGDLEAPERTVVEELMSQRLTRDIYSSAQLQEVMTDFWLNHFNVFLRKNEATPYQLVSYERDVIRPRALGHFEDLLEAVAHSPAMLMYLDNAESIGPDSLAAERAHEARNRKPNKKKVDQGLNENYARELMELHTLGVNGGYTQADVVQAARILTGWTVDQPQRAGGFRFEERRHEPGTKKVMGKKFKEHGEQEGRDLLHFLATRPATAQFLSRKLAVRFVSDDPSQALVDRMAKTYMASDGDMAAVMRTLYRSPEFWSEDAYRAKVKTPLEFVVSALRASNANVEEMRPLIQALREMGMPLYGCVPPTGYKEDAADWVSTGALANRMNFALKLSSNRVKGVQVAWTSTASAGDVHEEEARLEGLVVPGGLSDATRTALLASVDQQAQANSAAPTTIAVNDGAPRAPASSAQEQALAGLLLGSPEFQRR